MITTKFLRIALLFIFSISLFPTSQGQILKRLKRKIERKIENKIERKVDKTIDDAIEGDIKKEQPKETPKGPVLHEAEDKDFGDVNIESNKHESIGIGKIGKVRVFQNGNTYRISGSWWTHSADIPDGFTLEIKNASSLKSEDNPQKTKFRIPEDATLHLAYDPSMPHFKPAVDNKKQAVTDQYISYNISQGVVSIYQLDDNTIHFGFSGEDGLKGSLQGQSPEFIIEESSAKKNQQSDQQATPNLDFLSNMSSGPSATGTYNFSYEFVNEITTDQDKETYKVSYLFNANEDYFGMKVNMSDYSEEEMSGETIIVYDDGNSFIFVDAQGMKIQMSAAAMESQQQAMPTDQMANYDYSDIKKTGATKTILGYTCHEYTLTDQSNKIMMWVAPDFKIPNWFTTQQNKTDQQIGIEGYCLEYNVESKDGNMTMKTVRINEKANVKVVGSDYRKMF